MSDEKKKRAAEALLGMHNGSQRDKPNAHSYLSVQQQQQHQFQFPPPSLPSAANDTTQLLAAMTTLMNQNA